MNRKSAVLLLFLAALLSFSACVHTQADADARRAFKALESVVRDAEAAHPQCADMEALQAARVHGTNGWPALLRAGVLADKLLDDESDAGRRVSNWSDSEWPDFMGQTDEAVAILEDTESIQAEVRKALLASCLAEIGAKPGFGVILNRIDLARIKRVRIAALQSLGRGVDARNEMLELLQLSQRGRQYSNFVNWIGSRVLLQHDMRWVAVHLPRLQPDAAFTRQLSDALQPVHENFRAVLEGELAMLLHQARTRILDFAPAMIEKRIADNGGSAFDSVSEYLNEYIELIRAASAALKALGKEGSLGSLSTLRAVIEAARPHAKASSFNALTEGKLRTWAAGGLRLCASELLLRVRLAEQDGAVDPAELESLHAKFSDLRVQADKDEARVRSNPDSELAAWLASELSDPLVEMTWQPPPPEKREPARDSRRFR